MIFNIQNIIQESFTKHFEQNQASRHMSVRGTDASRTNCSMSVKMQRPG